MNTNYPLLLTYRGVVPGLGFTANVVAQGRIVASHEGSHGYWLYGVEPGAVSAGGATLAEAFAEFHNLFNSLLFDIAAESSSFEGFKESAERFFYDVNAPNSVDWDASLRAIRAGDLKNTLGLPRASADDIRPGISVVLRTMPRPEDSAFDAPALAA